MWTLVLIPFVWTFFLNKYWFKEENATLTLLNFTVTSVTVNLSKRLWGTSKRITSHSRVKKDWICCSSSCLCSCDVFWSVSQWDQWAGLQNTDIFLLGHTTIIMCAVYVRVCLMVNEERIPQSLQRESRRVWVWEAESDVAIAACTAHTLSTQAVGFFCHLSVLLDPYTYTIHTQKNGFWSHLAPILERAWLWWCWSVSAAQLTMERVKNDKTDYCDKSQSWCMWSCNKVRI